MRTFRWNAPIIIGAGALALSLFAPAPLPLQAEETGAIAAPEAQQPSLSELKARLDRSDRMAALQALELALSEVGDGVTLIWQRPARALTGRIKPVSVFRDDRGRICRPSSTRSRSATSSARWKRSPAAKRTAPGRCRVKEVHMAKHDQGNIASKRSSRRKRLHAELRVQGERFTPLLSRAGFTFSRMRINRDGARTYSAICFPGWVRA